MIDEGEKYKVDHLHRFPTSKQRYWHYTARKDSHDVLPDQILDVQVEGDWTLEDRNWRFVLSNEKEVQYVFKQQLSVQPIS